LVPAQSSHQVEIISPVNPFALVVPGGSEPKSDFLHPLCVSHRDEETAIELQAVEGVRIDFLAGIQPSHQTITISPRPVAPSDENVAIPRGPLALNPDEVTNEIEDHVVAAAFGDRSVDIDSNLGSGQLDGQLCDGSFLISCHIRQPNGRIGWAVSV
jgi:hypothetical protein